MRYDLTLLNANGAGQKLDHAHQQEIQIIFAPWDTKRRTQFKAQVQSVVWICDARRSEWQVNEIIIKDHCQALCPAVTSLLHKNVSILKPL